MRVLILLCAALCFALITEAQLSVDLDDVTTVTFDENASAIVQVRTPRSGVLKGAVFVGPEVSFSVAVEAEAGVEADPIPLSAVALPSGRHKVLLRANGWENKDVQVRLVLEPALDAFEPNNSRDTARALELPFAGLVQFSRTDQDWYVVRAPSGHLIGAQLRLQSRYAGAIISFFDEDGALLYQSDEAEWGAAGMRYVPSEGRPIFIQLKDIANWRSPINAPYVPLLIKSFPPARDGSGVFVKLDMQADDDTAHQMNALGQTISARVTDAASAESIAEELNRVMVEDGREPRYPWIGLMVVFSVIIGVIFVWRRRNNAT